MTIITACVLLHLTHQIRCVESYPPPGTDYQKTVEQMHRKFPLDRFWIVTAKPKPA